MKYLLLIYSSESDRTEQSAEERAAQMARWRDVTREMMDAGVHLGGEALQTVSTATTVRNRSGQSLTTDGPFAETKEQLGGFYFVDVENLDEALRWAAKLPAADYGSIEVRPIFEY
ncbi:MAG: YciI family protein [Myxococcales bacterium]|nr:YciI family protein [Myxococcales bacterium]